MNTFDDTTTLINFEDYDEDRTLILNGLERLKYFKSMYPPVQKPLKEKPGNISKWLTGVIVKLLAR